MSEVTLKEAFKNRAGEAEVFTDRRRGRRRTVAGVLAAGLAVGASATVAGCRGSSDTLHCKVTAHKSLDVPTGKDSPMMDALLNDNAGTANYDKAASHLLKSMQTVVETSEGKKTVAVNLVRVALEPKIGGHWTNSADLETAETAAMGQLNAMGYANVAIDSGSNDSGEGVPADVIMHVDLEHQTCVAASPQS